MKNFILFAVMFVAVVPVTMAQVSEPVPVALQCEVPKAVVRKPAVLKAPNAPPAVRQATVLPMVGWSDTMVLVLGSIIALLALVVAFLLGRVTTPVPAQQVLAPVVYVQPPPPRT